MARATKGNSTTPPVAASKPCPICGRPSAPEARPFCSKRCADIDLHRWLGGVYAVPAEDSSLPEGPSGETDD